MKRADLVNKCVQIVMQDTEKWWALIIEAVGIKLNNWSTKELEALVKTEGG